MSGQHMCCREVVHRGCDRCQDNIYAVGRWFIEG